MELDVNLPTPARTTAAMDHRLVMITTTDRRITTRGRVAMPGKGRRDTTKQTSVVKNSRK
jgi:hypothetical protein